MSRKRFIGRHVTLASNLEGHRELLGFWVGEAEGAKFWPWILTELNNRGVEDIQTAAVDGLKGFPDAIAAVFPQTHVQLCIVQMVRNSLRYVGRKHPPAIRKVIYTTNAMESIQAQLRKVTKKHGAFHDTKEHVGNRIAL